MNNINMINSYGIICIKIDNDIIQSPHIIQNYINNKNINYNSYDLDKHKYKDKIKFLLIQRKYSFAYVDFIRGKYDENNTNDIIKILSLMTKEEIENIFNNEFLKLWKELWQKTANYKQFNKEFNISQDKFNNVKNIVNINMINMSELYKTPEWGFPKGRKNRNETNIKCAQREFREETNLDKDQYIVLSKLNTFEELVYSQDTLYRLVYYIALAFEEYELQINNIYQTYEVGMMRWVTYDELILCIRDYYKDKIALVNNVYFIILNLIDSIYCSNVKKFDNLLI